MKNRVAHLLSGILVAALTFGCHVTTSPTGSNTTSGSMTAKVNGKSWSTIGIGSLVQSAIATRDSSGLVTVTGADPLAQSHITLLLPHPSVGTVSMVTSGTLGNFAFGTVAKDQYVSASGSVSISKFDTVNRLISGTFNFTAYQVGDTVANKVEVTNGTFVDVGWSK